MTEQQAIQELTNLFLFMFFGGILTLFIRSLIVKFANYMNKKHLMKTLPNVQKIKDDTLCTGITHNWETIQLAMLQLKNTQTTEHMVCLDCGFIAGTDYKLNDAALAVLREKISKKKKLKEIMDQMEIERDDYIEKQLIYITEKWKGVKFNKEYVNSIARYLVQAEREFMEDFYKKLQNTDIS